MSAKCDVEALEFILLKQLDLDLVLGTLKIFQLSKRPPQLNFATLGLYGKIGTFTITSQYIVSTTTASFRFNTDGRGTEELLVWLSVKM